MTSVVWLLVPLTTLGVDAPTAAAPPVNMGRFAHSHHVPIQWIETSKKDGLDRPRYPEALRDCTGCHSPREPSFAPSQKSGQEAAELVVVCTRCHYGKEFKATPAAIGPLPSEEARAFRHQDHFRRRGKERYACRQCHEPDLDAVPAQLPIPAGSGFCLDCHDPSPKEFVDFISVDEIKKVLPDFLKRLNASTDLSPAGFRGFSHAEHIQKVLETVPEDDPDLSRTCLPCHGTLLDSKGLDPAGDSDLAKLMVDLAACRDCHVALAAPRGAAGLVAREFQLGSLDSASAGTFSHADHLSAKALAASPRLKARSCFECHPPLEDGVEYSVEPGYEGCAAEGCHGDWRVVPSDLPQQGILEPEHKDIDTGNCSRCHAMGRVSDMPNQRPVRAIQRQRGLRFSMQQRVHPFIGASDRNEEDCGGCHVAALPVEASRLQARPFSHATHLPPKAANEDCTPCHASIPTASAPGEPEASGPKLYDEAACKKCHQGSVLEPVFEEALVDVPLFAHRDHVGKALPDGNQAAPLSCVDCHEGALPDGQARVGVKPQALRCSPCHSHRERPGITGGVSVAYVESCLRCHARGVPPRGPGSPSRRDLLTGVLGRQYHPHPDEGLGTCAQCHRESNPDLTRMAGTAGLTAVGVGINEFHKNGNPQPAGTRDCTRCHWGKEQTGMDPLIDAREKLGERMEGYPGPCLDDDGKAR